jgi:cyclin H
MTDLEFTHTPSQISLAAWYLSSDTLVISYLDWKYPTEDDQMTGEEEIEDMPFGSAKDRLLEIVKEVAEIINSARGDVDLKKVKEVDKRLKGCTNPEKVPGSALYVSSMSRGFLLMDQVYQAETGNGSTRRNGKIGKNTGQTKRR